MSEIKHCLICGKEINPKRIYCSVSCQVKGQHRNGCHTSPFLKKEVRDKAKNTILKKYGVDNVFKIKEIRDKGKTKECINKRIKKSKITFLKKYGVDWNSKTDSFRNKIGILLHNDENSKKRNKILNDNKLEIRLKTYRTRKEKGSLGLSISNVEKKIYEMLKLKFFNIKQQYISKEYPWKCDFYIPKLNIYIEYNGYWQHGKEPYIGTTEQNKIIKEWKLKNTQQYNRAIDTWTKNDVLKRNTAKKNNLNYLEFFSINEFNSWFNKI